MAPHSAHSLPGISLLQWGHSIIKSTFLRGYDLKGCDLLFHPGGFALGTPNLCLLIFGNCHNKGKLFLAFIAPEIISGHDKPPEAKMFQPIDNIFFIGFVNMFGKVNALHTLP